MVFINLIPPSCERTTEYRTLLLFYLATLLVKYSTIKATCASESSLYLPENNNYLFKDGSTDKDAPTRDKAAPKWQKDSKKKRWRSSRATLQKKKTENNRDKIHDKILPFTYWSTNKRPRATQLLLSG